MNDEEMIRWQDEIRKAAIECSGAPDCDIDGGGCDSGDPLDLTLTEVRQGFIHVAERANAAVEALHFYAYSPPDVVAADGGKIARDTIAEINGTAIQQTDADFTGGIEYQDERCTSCGGTRDECECPEFDRAT